MRSFVKLKSDRDHDVLTNMCASRTDTSKEKGEEISIQIVIAKRKKEIRKKRYCIVSSKCS